MASRTFGRWGSRAITCRIAAKRLTLTASQSAAIVWPQDRRPVPTLRRPPCRFRPLVTRAAPIASAHRHDLDVWAYLRDILERLAKGETALEQLLPDVWKASHPQQVGRSVKRNGNSVARTAVIRRRSAASKR